MKLLMLMLMAVAPSAADKDVPDYAKQEIARRGYLVQKVDGEIHGEDVLAEALALPADDSGKFSLTIVYGANKTPMLDKLKADLLANTGNLGNWANVKDLNRGSYDVESTATSHLHVTFTQAKSPFKADWSHIKEFPTFVLQSPRNGSFGTPGTVINQHGGYHGADELAKWIEASIRKYVSAVEVRGHAQRTVPFEVLPKELPIGADPSVFPPDLVPTSPKSLTLDEIKEACAPDVPSDAFILAQLQAKPTSKDQVKMAWMMEKMKGGGSMTMYGILSLVVTFLIGSGVGMAVLKIGSVMLSGHAKTTPSQVDDVLASLVEKVVVALEKKAQSVKAS
jgi:hypothetical protein